VCGIRIDYNSSPAALDKKVKLELISPFYKKFFLYHKDHTVNRFEKIP
jgi:hypothetical protein